MQGLDLFEYADMAAIKEFEHFLKAVENRWLFLNGYMDKYDVDVEKDPALGLEVEYFHPSITCDDRMVYIMNNIVMLPDSVISPSNKICNTIISHFYGARGIHSVVTGIRDPKQAHVDFERVLIDDEYVIGLRTIAEAAKKKKIKFFGTTELHTSLQTSARNYCRVKYNDPKRLFHVTDIIEWVASFIQDGTVSKILNEVGSLKDMFTLLKTQPGIGNYYGYHCATSNSVNPALPFNHDESFCSPGPGATIALRAMFPRLFAEVKKFDTGELVIWFRNNQTQLMPELTFHPATWNVEVLGNKVFESEQNELKTYGTEVGMCQFSVYLRLRDNPHLISKRKIARNEDETEDVQTKITEDTTLF